MLYKKLHRVYCNFVNSLYLLTYFESAYKQFMCTQASLYVYRRFWLLSAYFLLSAYTLPTFNPFVFSAYAYRIIS